ncbi:MAG: hypothetical protein ABIN69_01965 [Aestuariivirga sp.]
MNISTKISAALAVAALSVAFMGFSTSANAAGSLLQTCKGSSRGAVISCCQAWVNKHGRPIWMGDTGSCSSSVACGRTTPAAVVKIAFVKQPDCYLQSTPPESKSGNPPKELRG